MVIKSSTKKKLLLNVISINIEEAVSEKLNKKDWSTVEELDHFLNDLLVNYEHATDAINDYYENLPDWNNEV